MLPADETINKEKIMNKSSKIILVPILLTLMSATMAQEPDLDAGETAYNNYGCMGCHGMMGEATADTTVPNLAGQNIEYTVIQLKAFASGERKSTTMQNMARMVSGKELDIAAYLYDISR